MTDAAMLDAFAAAMETGPDMIVSVPAESFDEQRHIAAVARAWNAVNGHPISETVLGFETWRDVTPEDSPYGVAEVYGLHVRFTFPASVGPDPLLAFAELVEPYAWPDRPTLRLEHAAKGHEA